MLIFLIFCIGFVGCRFFDVTEFKRISKCENLITVKIASVNYEAIKLDNEDRNSFLQNCLTSSTKSGIYPYGSDLPMVSPKTYTDTRRISSNIKNRPVIDQIEKIIQDVDFIKDLPPFKITDGIIISNINENQILFVWNPDRTFLILVNMKSIEKNYNITLGRDLIHYDYFKKLPSDFINNDHLIFEISTSILVKFGCQIIPNNTNESTVLPLSLSKYRLKNLGGENIFVQGPCLNNSEMIPNLEIRNKNNPNLIIPKVSLTYENNSFTFMTPSLWYIGLYQFKISYQNYDFISDVEIYSIDGNTGNIQIEEIEQMNNPNYNKNYIVLKIPNYVKSMNFFFYTLDLFNKDNNKIPFQYVKTIKRVYPNDTQVEIEFQNIIDEQINIYQQIGFIGYAEQSKEKNWTNSFSLIWMKNTNTKDYESQCKITLSKPSVEEKHFCPDKLTQSAGLLSTFRILSSNTEYFSNYNEKFSCFAQVIISENGSGVTCCYNKTTKNLVYGQDFYLRNNIPIGSYSWKISPFYDLQKHFIHDLMPLHSCCSIISNEFLCTEFWNKFNSINIKTFEEDLRADVFGDPHIIPYKSSSRYSFLGSGDFQLILTKDKEFNLQGRFHYNDGRISSLLKAIVFKIPSIHLSITTSSNNKTNLYWKIITETQKRSFVEVLPFQQKDLLIFQSTDTKLLYIYLRLSNDSRIYIVLERINYNYEMLEFINMRVHLSNNMKHNINGGLFGRLDNNSQSTGLYLPNSSDFIQNTNNFQTMFNYSYAWNVQNDENLFFDSNFLMPKDKFTDPNIYPNKQCKELDICNIDANLYSEDTIVYEKTINAYEYRVKLDTEWKSLINEKKVCDHPTIKLVKYNSDNFTEFSKIHVSGCIESNKTIGIKNPSMECKRRPNSSELVWELNFQNEICQTVKVEVLDKPVSGNEVVYAGIGLSVLFLIVLCFVVAFVLIKRRKKHASKTKGEMELSTVSDMTIETTYDTVIGLQDEYCTYAEIKKK